MIFLSLMHLPKYPSLTYSSLSHLFFFTFLCPFSILGALFSSCSYLIILNNIIIIVTTFYSALDQMSWVLLYEFQNNPLQVIFLHLLYKWGKWGIKRWSKFWPMSWSWELSKLGLSELRCLWCLTVSLCCLIKPCLHAYLHICI